MENMHPAYDPSSNNWAEEGMRYRCLQPAERKLCMEHVRNSLLRCATEKTPLFMSEMVDTANARMVDVAVEIQLAHHDKLRKRGEARKNHRGAADDDDVE